jgi:hypothetical protein
MFELGGETVTWGMAVLTAGLVGLLLLTTLRQPRTVGVVAVVAVGVHAVAFFTSYLDPATLASAWESAVSLSITAFFAVAAALDSAFVVIRSAIEQLLAALSETAMPGAGEISVLDTVTTLLLIVLASALVCGMLILIHRWSDDSPVGGLLAGLGVVFGVAGIVWTWLPVGLTELTALHLVLVVCAIGVGYGLSVVLTGFSLSPKVRKRVRQTETPQLRE